MAAKSFPNVNLGAYFNDVWAPGAGPFSQALQFYQRQLRQNAAGNGLDQLAQAQAANASGAQYQQPNPTGDPTQGPAQNQAQSAEASLQAGNAGSRATGRSTKNQVEGGDISGALNTSQAFGNSLTQYIQSQIALRNAQAQQPSFLGQALAQVFDPADITGLFGSKGFFAPDPLHLGSGPGGSLGSLISNGTPQADTSLNQAGAQSFSPASGSDFATSSGGTTLPSFINPSDIMSASPASTPGIFSSLFSSGGAGAAAGAGASAAGGASAGAAGAAGAGFFSSIGPELASLFAFL